MPKSRRQSCAPVPRAAPFPTQVSSVQEDLESHIQRGGAFRTYIISTSLDTVLQGTYSNCVGVVTDGKHEVVCSCCRLSEQGVRRAFIVPM